MRSRSSTGPTTRVTVAEALRIALVERWRLSELAPGAADFHPALRAWLLAA